MWKRTNRQRPVPHIELGTQPHFLHVLLQFAVVRVVRRQRQVAVTAEYQRPVRGDQVKCAVGGAAENVTEPIEIYVFYLLSESLFKLCLYQKEVTNWNKDSIMLLCFTLFSTNKSISNFTYLI